MTLVFSSASNGIVATVAPWVVAILTELEKKDNSLTEWMKTFRFALIHEVKKRLEITAEYLIASALHPTFKFFFGFWDDDDRINTIKERLREEFNAISPTRPQQEQISRRFLTSCISASRNVFINSVSGLSFFSSSVSIATTHGATVATMPFEAELKTNVIFSNGFRIQIN
ncbi:hypothetical protein BGX27_002571 [Mortierella sp. AM989]|nr:hypothetical protein BGX27_002571 [Mortierella sp. AM989]